MTTRTQHDLYATERSVLATQLRSLTPEQASSLVPSCPEWSVKDVLAHVSGLVAEKLADVTPPLGSDEATQRQVKDRADMALDEVLHEWEQNAYAFEGIATDESPFVAPFLCDLVVHACDIREGLSLPIDQDSEAMKFAADRYLGLLLERAAERNIALSVELAGVGPRVAAPGESSLHLHATPYEFLRAVTARRTRAEVEALNWDGDPTELLDTVFAQYGPLKD